jgi:hypothetical protein
MKPEEFATTTINTITRSWYTTMIPRATDH